MNTQQEYNEFMAKFIKAIYDTKMDFNKLSPENQQRFSSEANAVLRNYGYANTIEDLMRKFYK